MLEGYIVTLPDGSVGSLADFYSGIMDESIQATDAGYVLSDGTLLPTQGEAMWNPDADVLVALMSPYLSGADEQTSGVDDGEEVYVGDVGYYPPKENKWKWVGIAVLAYLAYKEFGN
jgi:hypothetical protein